MTRCAHWCQTFEDAFMMADVWEMTLSEKSFAETDWGRLAEYTKGYDIYVELVSDYYACEYFN